MTTCNTCYNQKHIDNFAALKIEGSYKDLCVDCDHEANENVCKYCKTHQDLIQLDNGSFICESCSLDKCEECLEGDCEVETKHGTYICGDCYSSSIDNAYESTRD